MHPSTDGIPLVPGVISDLSHPVRGSDLISLRLLSLRWHNERRTDFVSGDFFVGPAGIAGMSKILCKFVFW